MRLRSSFLVVVAVVLGVSEDVLAWGPATHIGLGASVLEQLSVVPAAIAAILSRHTIPYLFGNIAADVVFAKRLSRVKQFCHHWSTGFRFLERADDDRTRAFAYGYLSHLAADTVAHGKYVPRQIMLSDCTIGFGHVYWEMRADATADEPTWALLDRVVDDDHEHHHDWLAEHIKDTFLSYELNRLVFNGINALTVRRSFRRTLSAWNRYSRWHLSPDLVDGYRGECLDRIHAILEHGAASALLHEDPNGTSALMRLRVERRDLRRRRRQGLPIAPRVLEVSTALAPSPSLGMGRLILEPLSPDRLSTHPPEPLRPDNPSKNRI